MKRKFLNSTIYFLCSTLLLICSSSEALQAKTPAGIANYQLENNVSIINDDVVGRWLYSVADVAYEYSKGALYITENSGIYQVEIHVNNGTLHGQDVKVEQNKITFNLQVEGSNVAVTLMAKGDKLSGESSSADGVFKIEGKRKPNPQ